MIGGHTDPTTTGLADEIRRAVKSRDEVLAYARDRIRRYTGPYFRQPGDKEIRNRDPENHAFEFIALTQPMAVYNNPRVRVQSARGTAGPIEMAVVMRHAINRWIKDIDLKDVLKRLYPDYAMNFCVAMVDEVERKGYDLDQTTRRRLGLDLDQPVRWPQVRVIRPDHFVWDHGADGASDPAYMGHAYVSYVEDLLWRATEHPEEGWNREALQALQTDALQQGWYGRNRDIPERNEVVLWEIWLQNYELEKGNPYGVDASEGPDEGYHGTLFTLPAQMLTDESLGAADTVLDPKKWIRKPRPAYCSRTGPYEVGGYLSVPGEWIKLSALTAIESEVKALNAQVRAQQRSAGRMKQIGIGAGNEEDARKINQTQDGGAVNIPGFDPKLFNVYNFGSLEPGRAAFIELQRDRVNRISGLSDAMRGQVQSGATATENAIAAGAGNTRLDGYIQGFHDFVTRVIRKGAEHLMRSSDVVFGLGQEAAEEMNQLVGGEAFKDPIFQGGAQSEDSGLGLDALEIDIEPYSLPHQTEQVQQQRTAIKMQLVMQWLQFAVTVPGAVDVRDGLKRIGDAYDDPGLEDIVDVDALEAAGVAAQAAPKQEAQGGPVLRRQAGAWPSAQREVGRQSGAKAGAGARVPQPGAA